MFLRTLTVLMWRHCLARQKQFILTLIELFVPVLPFVLIYVYRETIFPKIRLPFFGLKEPEPILLRTTYGPPCVLYIPETNFTRILMGLVGQKLNLQLLKTLDNTSQNARGYLSSSDAASIYRFTENMGPDEAVVVFYNVLGPGLPESLNYSIRMKPPLILTESEESAYDMASVLNTQYEVRDSFMRLQWAIDTSFIQMLTGKEVKQKISLQQFPYAKYFSGVTSRLKYGVLVTATNLAILPAFFTFMLRLIIEKASGIQDLMKMSGVTNCTLITSHILNVLLPGLVYSVGVTVLMKLEPSAVLPKSEGFLIFLALFLQYSVTIFLALVGSYLARTASPTALTVLTVFILISLPAHIVSFMNFSKHIYYCGFIPFIPLIWILAEVCHLEDTRVGLTFETMMKSHAHSTGSALLAYLYFSLHIILCLILVWYFDHVIPGLYGSTNPWYFPFQVSYWFKSTSELDLKADKSEISETEMKYFEPPPEHLEPGIEVINVTKMYSKIRALDNLSLDVFEGEITVLLGHNGSGKTTLMSVITGMTNATKGNVLVNGFDMALEKTLARQDIGLCPQRNIFLNDASVIEHVMFFTLLNKGTFREAHRSSEELLVKLHLKEKAKSNISSLSGGMKRGVQLACALASEASVLILDEPTLGLDVETRRSVWNLLLSLRGSRTVLLSTHCMEEADVLGDRILVLHTGQLRSHATPMYLKRAIGTNYRLTFTTVGEPFEPAITNVIKTYVPKATVKEIGFSSISYNLPSAYTRKFSRMFSKLESKQSELDIDSIGVGNPTLEDVFLKIFSKYSTDPLEYDEMMEEDEEEKHHKLCFLLLFFSQTLTLIMRYLRFIWIYKFTQIVFGIIPIVIVILVITWGTNVSDKPRIVEKLITMNLDMYNSTPDYRILYKVNGTDSDLRPLSDQYPRIHFERTSDISEAMLRTGLRDTVENKNYLAGIELNDTDAKVLYTTSVLHTAPMALNLLSNLIATRAIPWASGRTLTVHNHPLPNAVTPFFIPFVKLPKNYFYVKIWLLCINLMFLCGFLYMVDLPCMEASGARHMHVLAGCSPELHWIVMLLAGTLQVSVIYLPSLVIACIYLDYDNTFSDLDLIVTSSVVVLLGSMAMLAFSYHISLLCKPNVAVTIISLVIIFSVIVYPLVSTFVSSAAKFERTALILLPPYTFSRALNGCAMTAVLNAMCKLNRDKCAILVYLPPFRFFDGKKCCESMANPWCYFCFVNQAPGWEIIYLAIQIFLYMTLVTVTQRGTFSMVEEKFKMCMCKEPVRRCHEKSVKEERAYVKRAISLPKKEEKYNDDDDEKIPDMMLVSEVHKKYQYLCSNFTPVSSVSFSVKSGECFGLLGVNGSGKSTLFGMLNAEQCPTKGRVLADGHELTFPYSTGYLYSLGYCPQFWNLDCFLTGRQNLDLLLALNGLGPRDTNIETKAWIKLFGLEQYRNKLVSGYSGGYLRRLAAASALCTRAPITLLDEPTTGVDVAARRLVWFAMKRALDEGRSIIISSHSLDQMEALCDRIAIMVAGEICALDSPSELRAVYASGHTIIMKIKHEHVKHNRRGGMRARIPRVNQLKATMKKKFKCTLKDEHKTMLHYHIDKTMQYSKLFREMEHLQASFPGLIEDYSVSGTTLEDVLLSFSELNNKKPRKKHEIEAAEIA